MYTYTHTDARVNVYIRVYSCTCTLRAFMLHNITPYNNKYVDMYIYIYTPARLIGLNLYIIIFASKIIHPQSFQIKVTAAAAAAAVIGKFTGAALHRVNFYVGSGFVVYTYLPDLT